MVITKQEITAVPPAWDVMRAATPHSIAGITVYDGHPEQNVSLVPDYTEQQDAQHTRIAVWKVALSATDSIWLTVSYSSTSVVLVKSLPEDLTELRVTYNTAVKIAGMDEIVRLEYR